MSVINTLANLAATAAARRTVTSSTLVDNRYIAQDSHDLARAAGLDINTYSLARMLSSEGSSGGPRAEVVTKIVMGQTAINVAGGVSGLFQLLSAKTPPEKTRLAMARDGLPIPVTSTRRFGRQGKWVGYAATSQDPKIIDVELAKAIIAERVPAWAKTGTNFLAPWGPGAAQAGSKLQPFPQVMQSWANQGKEWVGHLPGLDSFRFMAFKKTSKAAANAKLPELLRVYNDGLAGRRSVTPWDDSWAGSLTVSNVAAVGGSAIAILAGFTALALFVYRRYY